MQRADPYDLVPYPSVPFAQTHPDRLATIGRLYGLETVAPQRCRYLELGCGSGMNLLSMAALLPDAQFLGIDLAAEPIIIAQRHVAELGLRNLTFQQGDITALGGTGTLGAFDYITAHGVFSWVPPAVRTALLQLCASHLSAHGVAYISYNTLPGCHVRQMVGEMMRYHVRDITQADQRLEQSKALLQFLAAAKGGPPTYAAMLQAELDHLDTASPGSVHHDDLADLNQPFYFHEFMAQAQDHALQFLGEADLYPLEAHFVTPAVRSALEQMQDDLIKKEQYLDFLDCRRFRQTLLCRSERVLERQATPLRVIPSLQFASNATLSSPSQEPGSATATWICTRGKRELQTTAALVPLVLQVLAQAWPESLGFEALQARLTTLPGPQPSAEQLTRLLWELGTFRIIDLRTAALPAINRISDQPRIHRLVRWQVASGARVTALTHIMIRIEGDFIHQLVLLLDGSRTMPQVIDALAEQVRAGSIAAPPQVERSDAAAVRAALAETIPGAVDRLRQLALLDA